MISGWQEEERRADSKRGGGVIIISTFRWIGIILYKPLNQPLIDSHTVDLAFLCLSHKLTTP
jgi:hypothetical protein